MSLLKYLHSTASDINTEDNVRSKLKEIDEEEKVENEQLKKELKLCEGKLVLAEKKLKVATMALKRAGTTNLEKDLRIQVLEKKIERLEKSKKCIRPEVYKKFEDEFTADDLKNFRSVKSGANNDSSFILQVLRSLYKSHLGLLATKSVTGRSRRLASGEKDILTPEKKALIEKLLQERIIIEEDTDNHQARLKKFNVHLNNAIQLIKL